MRSIQNPRNAPQQHRRATDEDRLPAAQPIRKRAQQRRADDPSNGRRRTHHSFSVFESVGLLQKPHTPDHVENGGRDEKKTGDRTAQKILWIPKDNAQCFRRIA